MTEYTPPLQTKLPKVGTTIFTVMSALAAEKGAVNLGQGFPDFDCDPRLVHAVTDAMTRGLNQYPPMPGIPVLREAVAAKVQALHGRAYNPATEITITAGATQAILTAILAVVRAGDEVIVLEPCYDSYVPNIELAGGIAVRCAVDAGHLPPRFRQNQPPPSRREPAPSSSTARTTPAPPSGPTRTCSACRRSWRPPTSC